MDLYLMSKYHKLSNKYPNLCFKFKLKDKKDVFILGIVTNNIPICFEVDCSLYNVFDVRELYENYGFSLYINGDIHSLNDLDLENVSYFDIHNNELCNYFGNVEEVIIPNEVNRIRTGLITRLDMLKVIM